MQIKGIDVSSYQGKPDWTQVANAGIKFALLRVHQQTGIDSSFEHNYKGCRNNGILVGVYKYSYAKTVQEAEAEADRVLEVLSGRGLDFPVFYDLEWSRQREQLSRTTISKIVKAFLEKIKMAGYKVGIYCNVDWYNNVLDTGTLQYDYWLAAYPLNDTGDIVERLRPAYGVGWQYSSKGKVPGISGNVDMDVFYTDYKGEMKVSSLWEKTAELLAEQTNYLEKASNSNLDSKTGNAGYGNYTKYARDVNSWGQMGCQGQPWCAVYQFWIDVNVFGLRKALEHMGNGFYNCGSVMAHAQANGTWHSTPKLGALVIFRHGAHIGRVTKVTDTMIYTNEGNTSSGGVNHVEANGGCVADKSYTRDCDDIDGYVWIDYGDGTAVSTPWKATGTATSTVDNLYVRATPNGQIIGELMLGNRFEINGVTSGKWTQVNVANIGVGWVWSAYAQKDGEQQRIETIPDKQNRMERLFVGEVTASELCVRTWAGTEYPQIKSYPTLGKTNLVDVMNYTQKDSEGTNWYYVRIAGKYYGFVHSKYIKKR